MVRPSAGHKLIGNPTSDGFLVPFFFGLAVELSINSDSNVSSSICLSLRIPPNLTCVFPFCNGRFQVLAGDFLDSGSESSDPRHGTGSVAPPDDVTATNGRMVAPCMPSQTTPVESTLAVRGACPEAKLFYSRKRNRPCAWYPSPVSRLLQMN